MIGICDGKNRHIVYPDSPVVVSKEPELMEHADNDKREQNTDKQLDSYAYVTEPLAGFTDDGTLNCPVPDYTHRYNAYKY